MSIIGKLVFSLFWDEDRCFNLCLGLNCVTSVETAVVNLEKQHTKITCS